jgi:hypothetical protein
MPGSSAEQVEAEDAAVRRHIGTITHGDSKNIISMAELQARGQVLLYYKRRGVDADPRVIDIETRNLTQILVGFWRALWVLDGTTKELSDGLDWSDV